jgi:transcriptional regulator with XRE-family HTH domain
MQTFIENPDLRVTRQSSIVATILKEVRVERGIHQAVIADKIGKSQGALAKIESGKSALGVDVLFVLCNALFVSTSTVISSAERHAALLGSKGWAVTSSDDALEGGDGVLIGAEQYYASQGFKRRTQQVQVNALGYNTGFHGISGISVMNSPIYGHDGMINVVDVFRFMLDPDFNAEQMALEPQPLSRKY